MFIKVDLKCHPAEPDVSRHQIHYCATQSHLMWFPRFYLKDMFKEMSLEIKQGSAVTTCYLELG